MLYSTVCRIAVMVNNSVIWTVIQLRIYKVIKFYTTVLQSPLNHKNERKEILQKKSDIDVHL